MLSKGENSPSYFYQVCYLDFSKRSVFSQVTENFGEVKDHRGRTPRKQPCENELMTFKVVQKNSLFYAVDFRNMLWIIQLKIQRYLNTPDGSTGHFLKINDCLGEAVA